MRRDGNQANRQGGSSHRQQRQTRPGSARTNGMTGSFGPVARGLAVGSAETWISVSMVAHEPDPVAVEPVFLMALSRWKHGLPGDETLTETGNRVHPVPHRAAKMIHGPHVAYQFSRLIGRIIQESRMRKDAESRFSGVTTTVKTAGSGNRIRGVRVPDVNSAAAIAGAKRRMKK